MDCVDESGSNRMGFIWSETTGQYTGSLETKAPRVLNIDEGQLLANHEYEFEVVAYMLANPNLNNSATLKVIITEQNVVAGISGGTTQAAGIDTDLVIDGSDTYDPDDDTSTSFEYSWSCYNASDAMEACVSATSGSVLTFERAKNFTIAAGELPLGTYTFELFAAKGHRNDTATATVIIVEGAPPKVGIAALSKFKYNPVIYSYEELDGTYDGDDVEYEWSLIDADVTIDVAFTVVEGGSDPVYRAKPTVDIEALTPGVTYTFRLSVTDGSGATGYSQVDLVVNENPSSGSLAVSPNTGYTIQTGFDFVALNWCDDDLPLTYKYSYTVLDDGADLTTPTPLADELSSASLTGSTLPVGVAGDTYNYTLTGQVRVYDIFRGYSTAYDDFRVLPVKLTSEQLRKSSRNLTTAALESGDPEASLQAIGATHHGMASIADSGDSRRRMLLDSDDVSTEQAARMELLETLEATFAMTDITEVNMETILSTLGGILSVPAELTFDAEVQGMVLANDVLAEMVVEETALTTTAYAYAGEALSYLLETDLFNNTVTSTDSEMDNQMEAVGNMTQALKDMMNGILLGASAGIGYQMWSHRVTMYVGRPSYHPPNTHRPPNHTLHPTLPHHIPLHPNPLQHPTGHIRPLQHQTHHTRRSHAGSRYTKRPSTWASSSSTFRSSKARRTSCSTSPTASPTTDWPVTAAPPGSTSDWS